MTEKHSPPQTEPAPHKIALAFDAQQYCHFLADCDWTEAQKCEFIEELWKIVVGFVDLGFGLHPIQGVKELSETLERDSELMLAFNQNSKIVETDNAAATGVMAAGKKDS